MSKQDNVDLILRETRVSSGQLPCALDQLNYHKPYTANQSMEYKPIYDQGRDLSRVPALYKLEAFRWKVIHSMVHANPRAGILKSITEIM